MRRRWDMRPARHAAEAGLTLLALIVLALGTGAIALLLVSMLALGCLS
jgi:hypothetical protein